MKKIIAFLLILSTPFVGYVSSATFHVTFRQIEFWLVVIPICIILGLIAGILFVTD